MPTKESKVRVDVNASSVLKKAKTKPVKKNVTFRIEEVLIESFYKACEDEDVSGNKVIEILITSFLSSRKNTKK